MNDEVVRPVQFELLADGSQMVDFPTTMGGALQTPDPSDALDGATKQYVDAHAPVGGGPSAGGPPGAGQTSFGDFGWMACNPLGLGLFTTETVAAQGIVRVSPIPIGPNVRTFDALAVNVDTAKAASLIRLGVYSCDATTFKPKALLLDAGTIDSSTTGVKTIAIALTVAANTFLIGVGVMLEGAAAQPVLNGVPTTCDLPILGLSAIAGSTGTQAWVNDTAVADGALPAAATVTTLVEHGSCGWVRRSG